MQSLSLSQLKSAAFSVRPDPVLRPFGGSFLVADPSLLLPKESPDEKWHLFFHTMFGVWEAVSDDGAPTSTLSTVGMCCFMSGHDRLC